MSLYKVEANEDYGAERPLLSLAQTLATLHGTTTQFCTPGHRMGRGFRLLAEALRLLDAPDYAINGRLEPVAGVLGEHAPVMLEGTQ
jgi:hypothetical protein